jgi:succinate-acetate transporter protein
VRLTSGKENRGKERIVAEAEQDLTKERTAIVEPSIAAPAPLGLSAFALTTFAFSVANAGLVPEDSLRFYIPLALFYGGLAQFVAGLFEFRNKNTFGATGFTSYGAFWIALGVVELFARQFELGAPGVRLAALGWFFVAWAIFTAIMWLGSWGVNTGIGVVFTLLLATFILLAIAVFGGPNPNILHIGGYVGIVTAIAAWYVAAADVINDVYGRTILPVGPAAG